MKVIIKHIGIILITAFFAGQADAAQVYEDFSGDRLDPEKWINGKLEEVLEIQNGKLISKVAGKCDDSGLILHQLSFPNPNSITSFSAKVKLVEGSLSGSANMIGPQLEGNFYSESGGDVWAGINLMFNGTNYSVNYGLNSSAGWTSGGPFAIIIQPNIEYTLKIEYDGNKQLTFSLELGRFRKV